MVRWYCGEMVLWWGGTVMRWYCGTVGLFSKVHPSPTKWNQQITDKFIILILDSLYKFHIQDPLEHC